MEERLGAVPPSGLGPATGGQALPRCPLPAGQAASPAREAGEADLTCDGAAAGAGLGANRHPHAAVACDYHRSRDSARIRGALPGSFSLKQSCRRGHRGRAPPARSLPPGPPRPHLSGHSSAATTAPRRRRQQPTEAGAGHHSAERPSRQPRLAPPRGTSPAAGRAGALPPRRRAGAAGEPGRSAPCRQRAGRPRHGGGSSPGCGRLARHAPPRHGTATLSVSGGERKAPLSGERRARSELRAAQAV